MAVQRAITTIMDIILSCKLTLFFSLFPTVLNVSDIICRCAATSTGSVCVTYNSKPKQLQLLFHQKTEKCLCDFSELLVIS